MGEGLHATVTTLAEIREYGRNTGLLPEIERTGLAGCVESDENASDDRAAGRDFECGRSDADLYLRDGEYFLLFYGDQ